MSANADPHTTTTTTTIIIIIIIIKLQIRFEIALLFEVFNTIILIKIWLRCAIFAIIVRCMKN